jgi:hypothetical protein
MKYTVEMSSKAMIYIPASTNIGSSIQYLIGGDNSYRHTQREQDDLGFLSTK